MIGILDYGIGNVGAIQQSLEVQEIPSRRVSLPDHIQEVTHLILPGVGHFGRAQEEFNSSGLREAVENAVCHDRVPILGICVGFQMMAIASDESPIPGLGWLKDNVRHLLADSGDVSLPMPHMGWNTVLSAEESTLFSGIEDPSFYFLHSFAFPPDVDEGISSRSTYGVDFTVAVERDNIYGVQFHPEKSHVSGLRLLANFARAGH